MKSNDGITSVNVGFGESGRIGRCSICIAVPSIGIASREGFGTRVRVVNSKK